MSWVFAAIAGMLFQSVRAACQKTLNQALPTDVVNWVRYLFGAPWIAGALTLCWLNDALPAVTPLFFIYCAGAAVSQIIGTHCLVVLMAKQFSLGITYANTQPILTVLLGLVFFQEPITWISSMAIGIGVLGVLIVSKSPHNARYWSGLGMGVFSGSCFSLTSLWVRQATLQLNTAPLISSLAALGTVVGIQTVCLGGWLVYRYRNRLIQQIRQHWRVCSAIGATSIAGSSCWFLGFTLTHPAYVQTVAQLELIVSLGITRFYFKESLKTSDMIGMGLILLGILGLLWL